MKRYAPYTLNQAVVYERDAEYLFEHVDLDRLLKVELKLFALEHHGAYCFFNGHHCPAQSQTAHAEFAAFKESFHLL